MATKLDLDVDISGIVRSLGVFGKRAEKVVAAALFQEAETVIGRSKKEFVPVDTGALWGSGHVQSPRISGGVVTVQAGFGGPSAPYALKVHEDLRARHKVGQAKYFETPFLESLRGLEERLADRLRREALRG